MRMRLFAMVPAIVILVSCTPGQSVTSDTANSQTPAVCKNASVDLAITQCTSLIDSKKLSGMELAVIFFDRGDAFTKKSDFDHAIADYDAAIELEPEYALAFGGRAFAYAGKLEYERAIEDYDQAVILDRNFALAFYLRGMAKLALCDIEGGEIDINTARALEPDVGR
jgi:tetratricopeptide (TPR) repeat protein